MDTIKLLSPDEVADILGVSKQTLAVWRCERRYELLYVKVGTCVRYRRSDVDKFIEQRTQGITGAEQT